ncbi:hypothetical protein [Adlercreutzia caecimuris]|uniref:hypothetical protein n=1 Tax=Adlercreutzia caecimuris TaxID=671266 RepID=UPI0025827F6A|nr:hypothetical protein [Adlercreutzia caecimuris]
MTKVANCGHDERGKYSGGKAGDQSGTEWYIREDYDFGQSVYLVHPDEKVNDLMARMAVNGARNDRIGYDQGQRTTFYAALKANKWIVASIKTPCESDCSSNTAALGEACVQRLKLKKSHISKDVYTGNLKAAFVAAGWIAYTYDQLIRKYGRKPTGCVQLNPTKHVNVVVEGASNLKDSPVTSATKKKVNAQVVKDVAAGKYGDNPKRAERLKALGYDPVVVQAAVNEYLRTGKLPSTVTVTTATAKKRYEITASSGVNVRKGAGTGYAKVDAYAKGAVVTVTETKTVGSDIWGKTDKGWFAIRYDGSAYAKKA